MELWRGSKAEVWNERPLACSPLSKSTTALCFIWRAFLSVIARSSIDLETTTSRSSMRYFIRASLLAAAPSERMMLRQKSRIRSQSDGRRSHLSSHLSSHFLIRSALGTRLASS